MTATVAERVRKHYRKRVAAQDAALRSAYRDQRSRLARTRVNTVADFRRWASDLRLDNGRNWRLEPFQEAFVRDLFTGHPENWLLIPEGNAKTTLVAALGLYHEQFTLDAKIDVAAASREQAGLIYEAAEGFIERARDDDVTPFEAFELHPGIRKIDFPPNRSSMRIKAADERTGDGIGPTLCLIDELHRHRDLKLYRTWRGKLYKRNGQMIVISTAGEPGSEFELTRERIRQSGSVTRKGGLVRVVSGTSIFHEYAVPEDGNPEDMRTVKLANPLRQITVNSLQEKYDTPGMTLAHWRRLTCNLATRSISAAISEAEWEAAKVMEQIPPGQPVWLGLDVAWKYDTTAAVPLWVKEPHYRLLGPASVLVPPRDGSTLHPDEVKCALREIHKRNPIHTVVMDLSRAEDIGHWIEDEIGCVVIARPQTNPLAAHDFAAFVEALRNGWLHHTGDPGLTQHALNAVARTLPGGDTRFERPVASRLADQDRRVIDALVAAAMVHSQASATEPQVEPWVIVR